MKSQPTTKKTFEFINQYKNETEKNNVVANQLNAVDYLVKLRNIVKAMSCN